MAQEPGENLDPLRETLHNPEWKAALTEGVQDNIDNFELFNQRIYFAPANLTTGVDDRDYTDLRPEEQDFIMGETFKILDFDPETAKRVTEYEVDAPPASPPEKDTGKDWHGKARVEVHETSRSESDGMFLHTIYREGSRPEYVLATEDYRFIEKWEQGPDGKWVLIKD